MEWLGAATWTGRQRLSEREVSESNPAKLPESYATGFLDSARNDFYGITPTVASGREPFRAKAKRAINLASPRRALKFSRSTWASFAISPACIAM